MSSTVKVYINIGDINDNAPIFDHSLYTKEVLENVDIGTSILTVTATDTDSGMLWPSWPSYVLSN